MKSARWFYALFLASVAAGLLLIVAGESWVAGLGGDLLLATGESLLIAAFLAATVDRFVKLRLADEVANNVYIRAITGDAPDWYRESMLSSFRPRLISDSVDWTLSLRPSTDERFVELEVRVRVHGVNLSAEEVAWKDHWLLASAKDAPASTFLYFRLECPNQPAVVMEEVEIQQHQTRSEEGMARIAPSHLHNGAKVPAGSSFRSELASRVSLQKTDLFPLVNTRPARRTSVTINTALLDGIEFSLQHHLGMLTPEQTEGQHLAIKRYVLSNVQQDGATILLRLGEIAQLETAQPELTS